MEQDHTTVRGSDGGHHHGHPPTADTRTATDPVCGMQVDPAISPHHATLKGTDYHFCSAKCRITGVRSRSPKQKEFGS